MGKEDILQSFVIRSMCVARFHSAIILHHDGSVLMLHLNENKISLILGMIRGHRIWISVYTFLRNHIWGGGLYGGEYACRNRLA